MPPLIRRVLATDGFSRANANPLDGSWSVWGGGIDPLQIVSNQVQATVLNGAVDGFQTHTAVLPNDQWAQVTAASVASPIVYTAIGILLRYAAPSTNSGYQFLIDSAADRYRCSIQKYVAGAPTNLSGFVSLTVNPGDVFLFTALGTLLTVYQNGTRIVDATDATYAGGLAGLEAYPTSGLTDAILDDFLAGDFLPLTEAVPLRLNDLGALAITTGIPSAEAIPVPIGDLAGVGKFFGATDLVAPQLQETAAAAVTTSPLFRAILIAGAP